MKRRLKEIRILAKHLGVPLSFQARGSTGFVRSGHVYEGGVIRIPASMNESLILHELAHWVVATPKEREIVNYGCGTANEDREPRVSYGEQIAREKIPDRESQASMLGILIERYLGFDWQESAEEHGWDRTRDFFQRQEELQRAGHLEELTPVVCVQAGLSRKAPL